MRTHDLVQDVDMSLPIWKVVVDVDGRSIHAIADREQYKQEQKRLFYHKFEKRGEFYYCRTCGRGALQTTVLHPYARDTDRGIEVVPVCDSPHVMQHITAYCPECEMRPDPVGSPVLESDSFHNKPS